MRMRLIVVAGVLLLAGRCTRASETYSFALIGDGPYASEDSLRYEALIGQVNADEDVEWVIHAGDIKKGAQSCSDGILEGRLAILNRFEDPLILTPGDNEWTDCHTASAGGFDPLERLAKLRSLFYPIVGRTLGQRRMDVESQAETATEAWREFPENVRWTRGGAHFVTIHIVGSLNATAAFEGRTTANDEEVERRTLAGIEWLRNAFREATTESARGLFITIHGNPRMETADEVPAAFSTFITALIEETVAFGRPVILARGDSHYFIIDKPLKHPVTNERLTNFTRVETFGSSDVHWIEVFVDPRSPNVFSFDQRIVE